MTAKTLSLIVGLASLAATSQAEVLVRWDWENLTSNDSANTASFCVPCITPSDFTLNGINQLFSAVDGEGGGQYRSFYGWDANNASQYSVANRTDLSFAQGTFGFDVGVAAGATADFESLSMSIRCGSIIGTPPNKVQASLFWTDDLGQVQSATTGLVFISPSTGWNSVTFDFSQATAAFPSVAGPNGQNYHVEVFAANGSAPLQVDNVALNGSLTCAVPEPSGALLLGSLGMVHLLRRRKRA